MEMQKGVEKNREEKEGFGDGIIMMRRKRKEGVGGGEGEADSHTLNWKHPEGFHQSSDRCVGWYHLGRGKELLFHLPLFERICRTKSIIKS